jgi:RNA polymerase sigma-70 factor (ECF subfamily)
VESPIPPPSGPAALPSNVVERIRVGDVRALEIVFRAYYAPLCAFAARMLDDASQGEDIVQDVFSTVWSGRRDLRVDTSLRAYLYAAVRNRVFNVRKHDRVVERWSREEADDDVRELHPHPPRPDELLDRAELESRLDAALAALPARCGLAMRLRWKDGLRYAEIAQSLGISVKAVEQLLARGLRTLRDALS